MARGKNSLWYKDAIIYELHVKAFFDSSDDGIGDFRGLVQKLDYLQDLGVTAVWLLPFYPSPMRDDGYDISDYRGVHPQYGRVKDFRLFVREAHRRGIRVITELVINHTSDQHPWFQAERRARRGSARRGFFVWSGTDTRFPETRIIFTDTESSNWAWDPIAGQYFWHRFFSHQPDLNHNNPAVVKAVSRVLRFWLKMGVDGLRLDAVPYLCVREGTTNENLEETHEVIRQLRAAVDAEFSDRMLLAEANQWPADVRPYFGDGDECHMAFHFPLMPRIFMALSQEDRLPITDILRQTPDIPDNCQWALFLRNHDELTLEMVTDEERDYMYQAYALESRMRLNMGIRRRLAPLMNNSMRRIELLNSLLFSFPGTPIIYYGDEIGMGDNIFLGDRDGVRTPMQWSVDRNAGFSKADPARLYLPVIMDPVYGYGAVNVEAQERNPSSLLQFMRRLIALRRQHKSFGRGTMEFLHPGNRSVLAYVRRYQSEVILAVANLSRFVQAAELDLSEFQGWTPVEMFGRSEFPSIGEFPYFVTLGPHSFYWFRLDPMPEPVSVARGKAVPDQAQLPLITIERGSDLLDDGQRHLLEHDVLPDFMRRQRWFRSKARDLVAARMIDSARLGSGFYITFVEARYPEGPPETYVMPMKAVTGKAAQKLTAEVPASVMARLKIGAAEGVLCDALFDSTSCRVFYTAMVDGRTVPTDCGGTLQGFTTTAGGEPEARLSARKVRQLSAEQSNTSIVLDEAQILKVFRVLEDGPNPDLEVGRFLTEHTDFRAMAVVQGGLTYQKTDGTVTTVAMLQDFVANEGDGWEHALAGLRGYFAGLGRRRWPTPEDLTAVSVLDLANQEPPDAFIAAAGDFPDQARLLGRRTAEFHLALASARRQRDFAPRPTTQADLEIMADGFRSRAQQVFELLNSRISHLDDDVRERADRVLGVGSLLVERFQAVTHLRPGMVRIRIHGDYHLGQALRVEDDFILLDFEGEPLRPLAERRDRHSPLKDVAGMLRSFDYAAQAALQRLLEDHPDRAPRALPWARTWERWTGAAFLAQYLETAGNAPFLPESRDDLRVLLDAFLLDKALYELNYELNNRPTWVHVPLGGILEIAGRLGLRDRGPE
ncbi:MAG: maltose alpha-D-glucosyltransferase [Candidatus Krumholzibacteriia bacterium]